MSRRALLFFFFFFLLFPLFLVSCPNVPKQSPRDATRRRQQTRFHEDDGESISIDDECGARTVAGCWRPRRDFFIIDAAGGCCDTLNQLQDGRLGSIGSLDAWMPTLKCMCRRPSLDWPIKCGGHREKKRSLCQDPRKSGPVPRYTCSTCPACPPIVTALFNDAGAQPIAQHGRTTGNLDDGRLYSVPCIPSDASPPPIVDVLEIDFVMSPTWGWP